LNNSVLLLLIAAVAFPSDKPQPPIQPIPFSHKQHVALGLKCNDCHEMPHSGEAMVIPQAPKCMLCHSTIKTDSPAIKTLQNYEVQKREILWVRVYEIPSFVIFSHSTHIDARVKCEACHGPVARRDRLWRETPLSMAWCVNCHRTTKATTDCGSCHELQQ
jgi:hypothetical protein